MLKEFKEFVNQGNAMDLAIGVIIGAAFGKIVNSIVNDLLMPVMSLALGRVKFEDMFVALSGQTSTTLEAVRKEPGAVIAYGAFIQTIFEFFVVAFTIFLLVRQINKWRTPKKA